MLINNAYSVYITCKCKSNMLSKLKIKNYVIGNVHIMTDKVHSNVIYISIIFAFVF